WEPLRNRTREALERGARRYHSLDSLLDDSAVQVVFELTPHNAHRSNVLQALEAGRHVVCEKPLAMSYADACMMADAAAHNSVALITAYCNQHHPSFQEMLRLLRNPRERETLLGQIRQIQVDGYSLRLEPFLDWRTEDEQACLRDSGQHELNRGQAVVLAC